MDQVEKLCDAISLVNRGTVVLSGTMREVKSRYERNRVVIEFEGDDSFLKHESIAEFKNYSGRAEVKLKDHADSQALLREAVEQGPHQQIRAGRAIARRDLHSDRGRARPMHEALLIAKREYRERMRSKAFLFMTIAFPALLSLSFGGSILAARLGSGAKHVVIASNDPASRKACSPR